MIRVFPRRTKWTPKDDLAFVGDPPLFRPPDQPVKISVTFTWDIPEAERLYDSWRRFYRDVEIGGPALGTIGGEFVPGRFLKKGIVITSRGCPNSCWFCQVWRREPSFKELPITQGWNVADDNILCASDRHFLSVCIMLQGQKERPVFSGGLEARRLDSPRARLLADLKPDRLYFAYDDERNYEALVAAGKMMHSAGVPERKHVLFSYVLIGYPGDTFIKAGKRLNQALEAGFTPMAMLYRDKTGKQDKDWLKFQRHWARPRLIYQKPSKEVSYHDKLN